MWTLFVVLSQLGFRHIPHLTQDFKHIHIQHTLPVGAVEALDILATGRAMLPTWKSWQFSRFITLLP
jgi:hypothetical protein